MPGQQIIDEVTNDRIRFVTQFRDYAADKCAAASVPLQIDCAMRIVCAVDLRPAMRPARLFRPDFDEAEFPLQLRVAHDFIAQRSSPSRDDLDYCLHRSLGSTAAAFLQRLFRWIAQSLARWYAGASPDQLASSAERSIQLASAERRGHSSVFSQRAKHHINIDISFGRMLERSG